MPKMHHKEPISLTRTAGEQLTACTALGGFSLCEVVIAMGIFSVGVVSLLGLISVAMSSSRDALESSVASQIATGIIGTLNEKGMSAATNSTLFFNNEGKALASNDLSGIYTAEVKVVPLENEPMALLSPNIRQVTITIKSVGSGNLKPRVFCTLLANQG